MNHRPQGLEASKAIVGFLQYKGAEGLVPITFAGYERDLKFWLEHMGTLMLSKTNHNIYCSSQLHAH